MSRTLEASGEFEVPSAILSSPSVIRRFA